MSRVFTMGDIHGAYKALMQCLERSKFDKERDTLIQLGDICDGWNQVFECVEELLTVKNLIAIKGNHDQWFNEFCRYGIHPVNFMQGGGGTRNSYNNHLGIGNVPQEHIKFFDRQHLHYVDEKNRCFVHGGFDRDYPFKDQSDYVYYWDRDLWLKAQSCTGNQKLNTIDDFKEIYIGHTHVDSWRNPTCAPITKGGITNLDTGAGWSGKLTIMDIDIKEYWQSDLVTDLYPGITGRQ